MPDGHPASPLPGHGRSVLLVDDDPDWRTWLRDHLEGLGYRVSEVSDGSAALEVLEEEAFELILLDLVMPGLSGEDVARRVGADGPQVVFVTGADGEELASAMQTGARYYLPKGATSDHLALMLHALHLQ
ncbi:MAG TPA: response regulator [Myxococcaceae bacterium]|nr:response regulator [Myxococcaceae bacterium]